MRSLRPSTTTLLLGWSCLLALLAWTSSCSDARTAQDGDLASARLFATLPPSIVTPDGMAIAPSGELVVACPNFADQSQPACLAFFDRERRLVRQVRVPVLAETGVACPMGVDVGPDGDYYICDNQGWKGTPEGRGRGRMLRLRIHGDQVVSTTVVAQGLEHPNGCRVHGGHLYVTMSLMPKVKDPSGLLVSGVYRFRLEDQGVTVGNTLADPQLIARFISRNPHCQYGTDGLVFDSQGNLFVGIFGDGAIYKLTFAADGSVASNALFARTDHDYALPPKDTDFLERAARARLRSADGICIDAQDNLYVADFSSNAIAKVTPGGAISVIARNGELFGANGALNQPGEPIVWNGMLVISNFDAVYGPDHPDKVNTAHESPATLSMLPLR